MVITSLAALYCSLDSAAARANNRVYTQGHYRTYPRTPGEDLLDPKLAEHETKFYLARARSPIDLITPNNSNGRGSHAYATTTGYQRPIDNPQTLGLNMTPRARTGGSGSQFLELPRPFPPFTDIPQPPEMVMQDIAGRRRFADLIRRAGALLDPDPERYNNRNYLQGRYRSHPLTTPEDLFYEDHRGGGGSSQIPLSIPGGSNGRDPHAGASSSNSQTPVGSSQTPRPDITHHAGTGSSGSQFLEVPRPFPPFTAIVTNTMDTEQQPSSNPSIE